MQPSLFEADPEAVPPARAGTYREPYRGGATLPERREVAVTLAADVAAYEAGETAADTLYRAVRGSLYVLTTAESVRVARGLILLLAGEVGR